jgi:glycosyltransferase involved in cell wall biosynthesis
MDSLAAVLIDLIGDPEKCRYLGENGRRLVLETYNWEKVGAEMEKNIAETCCDAGTGGRVLGVQDIQSHLA